MWAVFFLKPYSRRKSVLSLLTGGGPAFPLIAGVALALHRKYKWGYKRINDLFVETQYIWNECSESDLNMIQMCEEETGIEVRGSIE